MTFFSEIETMQLQVLNRGLQFCQMTRRRSLDTAVGTVRTFSSNQVLSSVRPQDETYDGSGGATPNLKPVNLSYRALEWRGKEREKQTKSPLIIHHSLYGRKENWNPISEVSYS